MTRFKMIASGYGLFFQEEKVLLLQRQNTGYEDGHYGLPAGHIEDGETLRVGTCRELWEETRSQVQPEQLELVHVMHRYDNANDIRVDFFFRIQKWVDEPVNNEPAKCRELAWFPIAKLPIETIPYIKFALLAIQKNQMYSEFGWSK